MTPMQKIHEILQFTAVKNLELREKDTQHSLFKELEKDLLSEAK